MFYVDGLIPKNRLSADAIGAAAAALLIGLRGMCSALCKRFAELTSLKPGTRAYNRAEFRNILYDLNQVARRLNQGAKAPALLPLYEALSSEGVGPHPAPDLPRKWREGMGKHDPHGREQRYKSWGSHLRNRIALVRKALDRRSALSQRQRASILGADPLIAIGLREHIPRQMRLARAKVRQRKSLLSDR